MGEEALRIELQKIAEEDVTTHRAKIDQLSSGVNCSIRVLPDYDHTSREKFNCFEYALGLTEQLPNFRLADLADYGVLADWRFIDYLREQDILHEKPIDDLHDGDLVIYIKETKAEHSGKWKKGRVISKWGSGLMYDHEPYETPLNYGEPRYFKAIPFRETKDLFLNYARGKNVHEDLRIPNDVLE